MLPCGLLCKYYKNLLNEYKRENMIKIQLKFMLIVLKYIQQCDDTISRELYEEAKKLADYIQVTGELAEFIEKEEEIKHK